MKYNRSLAFAALVLALLPVSAFANLLAGLGGAPSWPGFLGPAIIDFDSTTPGLYNSLAIGNVKFNGLDYAFDISPNYNGQFNTLGVNSLQSGQVFNPILPSKIEMVFTIPVSAFAFNWGAADNTWKLDAYDSSNTLIETHMISLPNSAVNNGEYFGVSASDIKRVLLVDQKDAYPLGDHVFIDNFTSSFETVPEPAAPGILLAAACAVRARRRRAAKHPEFVCTAQSYM